MILSVLFKRTSTGFFKWGTGRDGVSVFIESNIEFEMLGKGLA